MNTSNEYLKRLGDTLGTPLSFDEGICSVALDGSLILSITNDVERGGWMINALLADEGEMEKLDPQVCLYMNFLLHLSDSGAIALTERYGPMLLVHRLPVNQMSYDDVLRHLESFVEAWRLVKLRLFFPEQADRMVDVGPGDQAPEETVKPNKLFG
jgi:hypothetical protein